MIPYPTKSNKLAGGNLKEVRKNAMLTYKQIEKSTRRKPYLRSAYFKKQKIFFDHFWNHLQQKSDKKKLNA